MFQSRFFGVFKNRCYATKCVFEKPKKFAPSGKSPLIRRDIQHTLIRVEVSITHSSEIIPIKIFSSYLEHIHPQSSIYFYQDIQP